jgi:hypothetical protein
MHNLSQKILSQLNQIKCVSNTNRSIKSKGFRKIEIAKKITKVKWLFNEKIS